MRTTIEIEDDHRARLLELAARRGEKGFSRLIREAIELYLKEEAARGERIDRAKAVLGTLSDDDANELRESRRELRKRWR